MNRQSRKTLLANTFGTLGYFSCIFSWGWAALLYLPMVLENKYVEGFLLPAPAEEVVRQPVAAENSPFMTVFAFIVTAIVIIATIVVLIKIPIAVAKTGRTVTTKAANYAVPIVTRSQPLPPVKKKLLTTNLIKLMKLLLVIAPIGATLLSSFFVLPLPYEVVVIVSSILSLFSLLWFSLQYILAHLLRVKTNALV